MKRTVKELLEQNKEKLDGVYLFLEEKTKYPESKFKLSEPVWNGYFLEVPEIYHDYIVEESILIGPDFKTGRPVFRFRVREKNELEEEIQQLKEKLKAYEATGLTPDKIYMLDRLYTEKCQEVAGYQKQMPCCKTGDLVYFLSKDRQKVVSTEVFQITQQSGIFTYYAWDYCFVNEDLGVEVFLTEDEARAALELEEGSQNGETEKEST